MKELIDKAMNGDTNAYRELIDKIKNELYYIARIILYNNEDIDDAIQECVYKAYMNLSKLREKEKFKSWIIQILVNECKVIYSKNKRRNNFLKLIKSHYITEYSENTINKVNDNLDFEILISKLNKKEKIILTLYYRYDYNTTDISKILNENPNTIRSRLNRAEHKLEKILKEGMENEL